MKSILKYSKGKGNTYIVHLDDDDVTLYDDLIIKYELMLKREIDEKELDLIKKEQYQLESYYVALKFLNVKMRSEKEVTEYLRRKEYTREVINEAISKLRKQGYLNDILYGKSFTHDEFVLTPSGPLKVRKKLESIGLSEAEIDGILSSIQEDEWLSKLDKLMKKKLNTYRHDSVSSVKMKMQKYFFNLGYPYEMISLVMENIEFREDEDVIIKEITKLKKRLERRFSGVELERQIKSKMYQKGFSLDKIDNAICIVFEN